MFRLAGHVCLCLEIPSSDFGIDILALAISITVQIRLKLAPYLEKIRNKTAVRLG